MTATPRYYTGRVLKAARGADLKVASMDDATKFGISLMTDGYDANPRNRSEPDGGGNYPARTNTV
jgi:hypothetical protein